MANDDKAPEKPKAKPQHPEFQDGGLYFVNGLEYRDAIYVDNDGSEYKAKVCPIPSNKGTITAVPSIKDPAREFAAIAALPLERQIEAVAEYQSRLATPAKALLLDGATIRLEPYRDILLYASERQVGEGAGARTVISPIANLLVNFSKDKKERWVSMIGVRPVEHVPGAAKGERTIPHFKLV